MKRRSMTSLEIAVAIGRRRFFGYVGTGAATLAAAMVARNALATPEAARAVLGSLAKGQLREGKILVKAPEVAENGNTVPITVSIESPMTEADYVRSVHIVADGNPAPGIASFTFTPASGKAEAQLRIRLAQTQTVIAVAEMSDGSLWTATREVKVTIGGCGG
jgi:sulfur-oxidizing protein SoxY